MIQTPARPDFWEAALARHGPHLTDVARAMGVSPSYLSMVRNGKRPMGRAFLQGVHRAMPDWPLGWLVTEPPASEAREVSA